MSVNFEIQSNTFSFWRKPFAGCSYLSGGWKFFILYPGVSLQVSHDAGQFERGLPSVRIQHLHPQPGRLSGIKFIRIVYRHRYFSIYRIYHFSGQTDIAVYRYRLSIFYSIQASTTYVTKCPNVAYTVTRVRYITIYSIKHKKTPKKFTSANLRCVVFSQPFKSSTLHTRCVVRTYTSVCTYTHTHTCASLT